MGRPSTFSEEKKREKGRGRGRKSVNMLRTNTQ